MVSSITAADSQFYDHTQCGMAAALEDDSFVRLSTSRTHKVTVS